MEHGLKKKISEEIFKICLTNWKWKHNLSKFLRYSESVLRGKYEVFNAYIRKYERSKINQLHLDHKKLEKEQTQSNLKLSH